MNCVCFGSAEGTDGAAGGHRAWLLPLPLPDLRTSIQRTQWRRSEPNLPAERIGNLKNDKLMS